MAKKFELTSLFPCPLCGKEPKVRNKPKHTVYCNGSQETPHILGTTPMGYETEYEARNAWNKLVQTIKVIHPKPEDTAHNGVQ